MKQKQKLEQASIIFDNQEYVYWKENGEVKRARKLRTPYQIWIDTKTIKKIISISKNTNLKTLEALIKAGVKTKK